MNLSIVVPQVFYDIIGRIVPGLAVLAVAYLLWPMSPLTAERARHAVNWLTDRELSPVFAVLSLATAAYLISIILEGFWTIPDLLRSPAHRAAMAESRPSDHDTPAQHTWFVGAFQLLKVQPRYQAIANLTLADWHELHGQSPAEKSLRPMALMYDEIRLRHAEAGARIVKLRAESHAYRRLILGWTICALLNLINVAGPTPMRAILGEFVLLAAIYGVIATYLRREEQWYWALCNHWLLLHYEPTGGKTAPQSNGHPATQTITSRTEAGSDVRSS
jgi:hypothetical protein